MTAAGLFCADRVSRTQPMGKQNKINKRSLNGALPRRKAALTSVEVPGVVTLAWVYISHLASLPLSASTWAITTSISTKLVTIS